MKNIFLFFLINLTITLFSCSKNKQQKVNNISITKQTQKNEIEDMVEMQDMDFLEEVPNRLANNTAYFDKYDKIEVIFYPNSKRAMGIPGVVCGNLLEDGKFTVDSIQTRIALSETQREKLETFLTTPHIGKLEVVDCYWPKHAILFYKNNKVDNFLEICFHCNNNCPEWEVLQGRYDNLEKLFETFSSDLVEKIDNANN